MKGFQEMKITLTKEQIKNQEFPEINIGKLTKEQAEEIAKIIYKMIDTCTIESNIKDNVA